MKSLYLLTISLFSVFLSLAQAPYCNAPLNGGAGMGAIINVKLGTLNNTSGYAPPYGYFYALTPPTLYRDSAYTLSVTFDSICHGGSSCAGNLDYTWFRVGLPFDTALNYEIFKNTSRYDSTGSVGANTAAVTINFYIHIPHTAVLGIKRLRIVRWGTLPGFPSITPTLCYPGTTSGAEGETEDYNVNIGDIPPPDYSALSVAGPATVTPVSVYPNPTTGIIHIRGAQPFTITNALGQVIINNWQGDYDMSPYPAGIYLLRSADQVIRILKN